jgi:outer membrane receptor protein involved in Fe transport
VFLPTTAGFTFAVTDPCSRDNLFIGPNPAARLAHCQADWAANADYGGNPLATAPGGPGFQDINENVPGVAFTNGGNPALQNEISRTKTIGVILQPTFAPGLTLVADHIQVDVSNGFVPFDMPTLLSICYDSPTVPTACTTGALFTRDPASGNVVTGHTATAVNAAHIRFRGQTFNLSYTFPLETLSGEPGWGDVDLNLQATHTDEVSTTFIAGGTPTRTDGTRNQPHWAMKFDAHYTFEKFRFNYSLNFLGSAFRIDQQSTTPTTIYPRLSSNVIHNASAQYDVTDELTLRAGINNFTNERPSFPSINYGDIIGRQYFVGLNAHL